MLQDLHAQAMQLRFQGARNIPGPVGYREHPFAPFHLQRNADLFKKSHGILGRHGCKGAVQKPAVGQRVFDQRFRLAVISNVAASFAGNIDFNAQLGVAFDQNDRSAPAGCGASSHHTGGAAAHDDDLHGVTP